MIATEWNFDSSPMRGDRLFHFRQASGHKKIFHSVLLSAHQRETPHAEFVNNFFPNKKKRHQVDCPVNYTCRQWSPETEREPHGTEKKLLLRFKEKKREGSEWKM